MNMCHASALASTLNGRLAQVADSAGCRAVLCCVGAGVVCELAVPDHKYPVASAFNDMSLHCFNAAAGREELFQLQLA
jgi:hypothetical protein